MTEIEVLQYKYDQAVRHIEELNAVIYKLRKYEVELLGRKECRECKEFKRLLVEFIGGALDKRQSDREEWIESLRTCRDDD